MSILQLKRENYRNEIKKKEFDAMLQQKRKELQSNEGINKLIVQMVQNQKQQFDANALSELLIQIQAANPLSVNWAIKEGLVEVLVKQLKIGLVWPLLQEMSFYNEFFQIGKDRLDNIHEEALKMSFNQSNIELFYNYSSGDIEPKNKLQWLQKQIDAGLLQALQSLDQLLKEKFLFSIASNFYSLKIDQNLFFSLLNQNLILDPDTLFSINMIINKLVIDKIPSVLQILYNKTITQYFILGLKFDDHTLVTHILAQLINISNHDDSLGSFMIEQDIVAIIQKLLLNKSKKVRSKTMFLLSNLCALGQSDIEQIIQNKMVMTQIINCLQMDYQEIKVEGLFCICNLLIRGNHNQLNTIIFEYSIFNIVKTLVNEYWNTDQDIALKGLEIFDSLLLYYRENRNILDKQSIQIMKNLLEQLQQCKFNAVYMKCLQIIKNHFDTS